MLSRSARLHMLKRPSAVPYAAVRCYAVPVNPSSSVDALLGTSVPPPPREGQGFGSAQGTHNPSSRFGAKNPNDISELLRGNRPWDPTNGRSSGSNSGGNNSSSSNSGARHAELQRIKGTAIGAERKGIPIPSRDEMLEEMFKRPMRELQDRRGIVDREHPHPIDALYGRNELDERVLAAARALHAASANPHPRAAGAADTYKAATISHLLERFESRAGYQLSIELPYEPTPTHERKVPLTSAHSSEAELQVANDDGVLLLAYVSNLTGERGTERISVCSGFAVEGGDKISAEDGDGKGALVISCAHTLRASLPSKSASESQSAGSGSDEGPPSDSIALAITRTGAIYPVRNLISSLAASDVILLQLGSTALSLNGSSAATQPVRTLPVSPYPAHVNSELSVSSFWGWEDDSGAILPAYTYDPQQQSLGVAAATTAPTGRDKARVKLERDDAGRSRWGRARLVEYKDPCGASAMVGTYDELAQLDYKLLVSSPANPPALQGGHALRLSSTVSEATRPAAAAFGEGTVATAKAAELMQGTRKPLPNFPPPGSSGGPVVDVETGSVVGVVRGHKMSALEGRRGDAVPAEKVFEFFALPGLGRKN
ncbi:hypothetical protein EX895_006008 [Sporisorium graminicola]|uniref:Uncharacterized protein n=1 Tax=Sporisorium graminicola TaxID=280036 RepID=A0A4U7KP71_9BASI|nr:hypothetical protein EX895_006008 [Sporisorium graminicola]TKY84928.1 hypothetical protein EX895_006008 [Sporisorium graminicola]